MPFKLFSFYKSLAIFLLQGILLFPSSLYGQNILQYQNRKSEQENVEAFVEYNGSSYFVGNKDIHNTGNVITLYKIVSGNNIHPHSVSIEDTSLYPTMAFSKAGRLILWGLAKKAVDKNTHLIFCIELDSTLTVIGKTFYAIPGMTYLDGLNGKYDGNDFYAITTCDTTSQGQSAGMSTRGLIVKISSGNLQYKVLTVNGQEAKGRDVLVDESNTVKAFLNYYGSYSCIVDMDKSLNIVRSDSLTNIDSYLTSPNGGFNNAQLIGNGKFVLSGNTDSLMTGLGFKVTERLTLTVFDSMNKPVSKVGFTNPDFENGYTNTTMFVRAAFNQSLICGKKHNFYVAGNFGDGFKPWQTQSNESVVLALDSNMKETWRKYLSLNGSAFLIYAIYEVSDGLWVLANTYPNIENDTNDWDMCAIKLNFKGNINGLIHLNKQSHAIYPNPTDGQITIDELDNNAVVEVYNNLGARISIREEFLAGNRRIIDLGYAQSGLYQVIISAKNSRFTKKLLKN